MNQMVKRAGSAFSLITSKDFSWWQRLQVQLLLPFLPLNPKHGTSQSIRQCIYSALVVVARRFIILTPARPWAIRLILGNNIDPAPSEPSRSVASSRLRDVKPFHVMSHGSRHGDRPMPPSANPQPINTKSPQIVAFFQPKRGEQVVESALTEGSTLASVASDLAFLFILWLPCR